MVGVYVLFFAILKEIDALLNALGEWLSEMRGKNMLFAIMSSEVLKH